MRKINNLKINTKKMIERERNELRTDDEHWLKAEYL